MYAGAAGGEGLTPAQGVEDGVAGVLLRPNSGQTSRVVNYVGSESSQTYARAKLRRVVTTPMMTLIGVFLSRARSAIVSIAAADEAKLERIDPNVLLDEQAVFESVAHVVSGEDTPFGLAVLITRYHVRQI